MLIYNSISNTLSLTNLPVIYASLCTDLKLTMHFQDLKCEQYSLRLINPYYASSNS